MDNVSAHCYVNLFLSSQNAFANVWDLKEEGGGIKKTNPKKEAEVEIVVLRRR